MLRSSLLLLLFTPSLLFAQFPSRIDSLNHLINKGGNDIRMVETYNQLITEIQDRDPVKSRDLIRNLEELSVKIRYHRGMARAYYQWGVFHNMQGRYDSLKHFAEKGLSLSREQKMPDMEAYSLQLMGTYYWQTGKYDLAYKNHLNALKIRENLQDEAGISSSLASLSAVSFSNNKPAKAEEYIRKALPIAMKLQNDKLLLRCYHTLANIYGSQGKYTEALKFDAEALKICARTDNKRGFSEIYSNMATCYFYMARYDDALKYHYKVLEIDLFFKDEKQVGDTYLNLAAVYRKKQDHLKAVALLDQSISLFKKTNYKYGLQAAYESLSQAYRERGDYKNAYDTRLKYDEVSTQLSNEANDKHIAELNIQYETEKKEHQIKVLSQQATIQELKIRQRNTYLLLSLGLLLVGSMLAYLVYNRRKLQEEARHQAEINRQREMAAEAIFIAEERERRRIAGDLHDGVGQTLSCALMNLNSMFESMPLDDKQQQQAQTSLGLLHDGYDEMRSISHQLIPKTLLRGGLVAATREFLNKIDDNVLKTSLQSSGLEEGLLNQQTETALYRIIQEAVNNVIKHARATKLFIQFNQDEDGISLTIEDNGRGFDSSKVSETAGIGLKNILSRVEYLRGSIEFDSSPGKGTLLAVYIPVTKMEGAVLQD